jgi:hypothetical protein
VADAVQLGAEHLHEVAPALRSAIEARLPSQRDLKGSRRVELEHEVSELYESRAAIELRDEGLARKLAQDNPNLNEREEILKGQLAEANAALAKTEEDLRQAGAGLGWLLQAGRIGKLRRQHQAQATALYGLRERLSEVRTTWSTERTSARDTEEKLQESWRLRTADIAKLTQELDGINGDFEGTCLRAAIEEWTRQQATYEPTGVGELDAALQRVAEWKQQTADCEAGVVAVSEIIGTLNGVREGLARMQSSLESVKEEQEMHSELSTLKLEAPPAFLDFHRLWDAMLETVQDEKRSIEHPKAFADIIRNVIDSYLTDKNLETMFTLAGDELNRATKEQWG